MSEHTATRWRFRAMGSEGCRIFPDTGDKREDMKFIAMVNGRDLLIDQANAAFICKAVNSHEALLAACKAALLAEFGDLDASKVAPGTYWDKMQQAVAGAEVQP